MSKAERVSAEKAERARKREAEQRAREKEEAAAARRRRKRIAGRAGSLLAMLGLSALTVFILTHSWHERVRLTGRLAGVREMSFTPAVQENGGVTPVCGCFKPHFNAWRGITFAAREAVISRHGRSPLTEWTISGAEAKEGIEPAPAAQRMAVEVIQMDPDGHFDPAWMAHGDLGRHGRVLSRSTFNAFMISLTTDGDLHVGLLGDVPVGAWIPLPRSEVSLTADPSPFPGTPPVPRMTETHPASRHMDEVRYEHNGVRGQGYPLGDFVGPNVVLWSSAPLAQASGRPVEKWQRGRGLVTAIRLKGSTFSTRVAAVPVTRKELVEHVPYMDAAPHGGREYLFSGRPDGTEMVVKVTKPLGREAYDRLRRKVLAHPVIHMRTFNRIGILFPKEEAQPGARLLHPTDLRSRLLNWARRQTEARRNTVHEVVPIRERDRYPPLPSEAGFNVFGPLHEILFRGVHGHLLLADKAKNLGGSADLKLDEVSGLRNQAGEEFVPAPLTTSGESASLQFSTVGEESINGVPQTVTSYMEQNQLLFAAISFVLTAVSAAIAIYAFTRGRG
jgi:hypothetical protein